MRVLSALALLLPACVATPAPTPSPTPAGTPAPTVAASSPTGSPLASPSPSPSPAAIPRDGIEARALGALSGQWAFVLAEPLPSLPAPALAASEVWAVPLDGGEPRLAARFVSRIPATLRVGNNQAYRQLSPDGRSVVLSVGTPRAGGGHRFSLVIVELETGRTRVLGSDDRDSDMDPAWSADGRRIAYVRRPDDASGLRGLDDGIWLMNVDGSGVRQLIPPAQGSNTTIWDWAPDGRTLAWTYSFEDAQLRTIDVDAGGRASFGTHVADIPPHSWRRAPPLIAGVFQTAPRQGERYIVVADHVGAAEREVARERDVNTLLANVRWHPTRVEILYLRGQRELHALEIGSAAVRIPVAAAGRLIRAEWSPTGGDIAYLATASTDAFRASELRYMRRDGANDRVLFAPQGLALVDLAVRRY